MMQHVMAKNLRINATPSPGAASRASSGGGGGGGVKQSTTTPHKPTVPGTGGLKHGRTQSSSGVGHNRSNQRISPRLVSEWCERV